MVEGDFVFGIGVLLFIVLSLSMADFYSDDPGVMVEYGIRVTEKGDTRFLPFGDFGAAESAYYDWKRDVPDGNVQFASRVVKFAGWEVREDPAAVQRELNALKEYSSSAEVFL